MISRRPGESVQLEIGENDDGTPCFGTVVLIELSHDGKARLGITWPKDLRVIRTEAMGRLLPGGGREAS